MTEPTIDVLLFRKTLEHVTAHPEECNMHEWALRTERGTVHCFGGWALYFAGREFEWERVRLRDGSRAERGVVRGKRTSGVVAARDLRLEPWQARMLFSGDNSIDELWRLAEAFTGGELRRMVSA